MKITKDNIGDVICKYSDGKRIMITGVDSNLIHYKNEAWGGAYCTDQKEINGTVDLSPDSFATFIENQEYAATLDYAESAALTKALTTNNRAEIEEAEAMLTLLLKQKEDFKNKLNLEAEKRKETLVKSFSQDLISMLAGSKTVFFGINVEKPVNKEGVVIDGELHKNDSVKNHLLGIEKTEQKKLPSLNDLLSSASKRSGNQNTDSHENIKNKVEIDRD